jgi:hypothetical protein
MGDNPILFHGSNSGLEVLGLCSVTGEPLGSRGIYQNGLCSGLETSMTTDSNYAIHWGYDVLVVSSLERLKRSKTISSIYQNGPVIYKFKGSLPVQEITGIFLDSLQLSFKPPEFLQKVKEHFPHAKVYPYSPDNHEKDGNLPYELFQDLL